MESTGHLLAGVTCDLRAAKQKIAGHKYQPHSPPLHPFNYFPLSVAAAKSPPLSPCLPITHVHETSVCSSYGDDGDDDLGAAERKSPSCTCTGLSDWALSPFLLLLKVVVLILDKFFDDC